MAQELNPYTRRDLDQLGVANPFRTYSNAIYPRTMDEVLQWAEWLWMRHGVYMMAVRRSIRYFLNELELYGDDLSIDERKGYSEQLNRDFNVLSKAALVGDDMIGFGNSFTSLTLPIIRSIQCPECGQSRVLDKLIPDEEYKWQGFEFHSTCPGCGYEGRHDQKDAYDKSNENGLQVIRWNPRDVEIDYADYSGAREYYLRVDGAAAGKIKDGDHLTLCTTPWEFIESVAEEQRFKFNKEKFRHFDIEPVATLQYKTKGWGMPLFMSCFSQVVQLQMLDRLDEAVATDFIIPLRYLTPSTTRSGVDPLQTFGMGNFMGNVMGMIKEHKNDPTAWHTLPAPVDYNVAGGEGGQLQQAEQIDRRIDNLLNTMGVATEFYRGSVTAIAGPPISLKAFERSWGHFIQPITTWINWYLEQCSEQLGWKEVHGRLVMSSIAEDDTSKQVKLNLASAGVVSQTTALKAFNIDPDIERERLKEERRQLADDSREENAKESDAQMLDEYIQQGSPAQIPPNAAQANMGLPPGEAAPPAAGGVMPAGAPGSAPTGAAPGGGGGPTLDQMQADAAAAAQQLFASPTRQSELANMKKTNPTLHALVTQELKNMEQGIQSQALTQAKSQGGM
jgi:hypothetical protein